MCMTEALAIVGIVAIGVTQVIIAGGIDLSSGSLVGAAAMVGMSFVQASMVNGGPNPAPVFTRTPRPHD